MGFAGRGDHSAAPIQMAERKSDPVIQEIIEPFLELNVLCYCSRTLFQNPITAGTESHASVLASASPAKTVGGLVFRFDFYAIPHHSGAGD